MFACVYVCVCYIRRQAIWKARAGCSTDFGAVLCKYLSSWGQPACLQVTIYVNVAHAFRIPYVRRGHPLRLFFPGKLYVVENTP